MSVWAVQQAGNFALISSNASSPWYDGGAQTALASIPQVGDTITNAGGFNLTFDIDLPAVASVLDSDTVYGAAGTYHAPDAAEVVNTAVFGPNSSITGTFDEAARNVDPGQSTVLIGIPYKIRGVAKTGTNVVAISIPHSSITVQGTVGRDRVVGRTS